MAAGRNTLGKTRIRKERRRRPVIGYAGTVAALKVLLPAVAVALIVLVAFWPRFLLDGGRFEVVADASGDIGIDRLSMLNPRFQGTDSRDRPFTVTAERAVQDLTDDDIILLARPQADMTLEDGAWVALKADQGFYHRDAETLQLAGGVDLFHDQGYEIHTPSAAIDLNGGTAEGHEPVEARGPFGQLTSEGFRVAERGARVEFTGRSRLRLDAEPRTLP
ncbi:MAG: LPS export ABC transporter periplasmic protein LptC [Pseudomonadota bacterium]